MTPPTPPPEPEIVTRARKRAAQLTERLAVPVEHAGEWSPASLSEGHAGVALAHALTDPRTAHAHLSAALRGYRSSGSGSSPGPGHQGLFHGDAALGFAARVAAAEGESYRNILLTLDTRVATAAGRLADDLIARLNADQQPDQGHYDTIRGITGLGRYLLAADPRHRPALDRVLDALVALAALATLTERAALADLGLAHGLAGPLALLAIAYQHDVRVTRQDTAIAQLADTLSAHVIADAAGDYWPYTTETTKTRAAWCYGTPGIAHALHLAAQALNEPRWARLATNTLRSVLDGPRDRWAITDPAVCHGAAGLLHVTNRLAQHTSDLAAYPLMLAELVLDHPAPKQLGLLDGATGVALALREFADGRPKNQPLHWDAALLLS